MPSAKKKAHRKVTDKQRAKQSEKQTGHRIAESNSKEITHFETPQITTEDDGMQKKTYIPDSRIKVGHDEYHFVNCTFIENAPQ